MMRSTLGRPTPGYLRGAMKILLPTDGSIFSEEAVQKVISAFRPEGAEVLVLAVVEPMPLTPPPPMAASYAPEEAERMRELFKMATVTTEPVADSLRKAGF
jgi:nucleotide-binding universal stress UspA family protein